ncbi:hypothetical protein [Nocardioides ganghwensis]|uniref:Uncharacterized protein n=1 Tax=Nocardioides ganghwensis TaxID=252230 RepID=A0A4Q2S8M6_9ACTN|nr:hypothetical protein [Nocardioides ganghwensis]MBD3948151.1 hypothetical protein [Nocardioides ganghwensis]RYB96904.1 hypothetical protein EUA07_20950 [Nocardioides ganghwensis]
MTEALDLPAVAVGEWVDGEERLEVRQGWDGHYWHLEVRLTVTEGEDSEETSVHVTDDQVQWLRDALDRALEAQRTVTPLRG